MADEMGLIAAIKPEVTDRDARDARKKMEREMTASPIELDVEIPEDKLRQAQQPTRDERIRSAARTAGGVAKAGARRGAGAAVEGGKFLGKVGATKMARRLGIPTTMPSWDLPGMGGKTVPGGGGGGMGGGAAGGSETSEEMLDLAVRRNELLAEIAEATDEDTLATGSAPGQPDEGGGGLLSMLPFVGGDGGGGGILETLGIMKGAEWLKGKGGGLGGLLKKGGGLLKQAGGWAGKKGGGLLARALGGGTGLAGLGIAGTAAGTWGLSDIATGGKGFEEIFNLGEMFQESSPGLAEGIRDMFTENAAFDLGDMVGEWMREGGGGDLFSLDESLLGGGDTDPEDLNLFGGDYGDGGSEDSQPASMTEGYADRGMPGGDEMNISDDSKLQQKQNRPNVVMHGMRVGEDEVRQNVQNRPSIVDKDDSGRGSRDERVRRINERLSGRGLSVERGPRGGIAPSSGGDYPDWALEMFNNNGQKLNQASDQKRSGSTEVRMDNTFEVDSRQIARDLEKALEQMRKEIEENIREQIQRDAQRGGF